MGRGHSTVWLPWRQTGRGGGGLLSKEGDVLRLGCPLLAKASSLNSTTTGADFSCKGLMDTEAQRGGLICPRSHSKLIFTDIHSPAPTPQASRTYPSGLWTDTRPPHCSVSVADKTRPQSSQKTKGSIQGRAGRGRSAGPCSGITWEILKITDTQVPCPETLISLVWPSDWAWRFF